MDNESIVYGCIKDLILDSSDPNKPKRRKHNRDVLLDLPGNDTWSFLTRDMFSIPPDQASGTGYFTDVIHFGASYRAIEYEWEQWIAGFEGVLKRMYWVSAIVHLQTELSGDHTFTWESDRNYHEPDSEELSVRCEWSQESAIA